ncbi:hypothetical protein TWF694_008430 [Orbilia ellipsospora]|uniref:CHAT domain-containing protein n=1 Tax=Orbilia ellipsospora TaxID=2528407 RepID=A0AAV9XG49_9PEZI
METGIPFNIDPEMLEVVNQLDDDELIDFTASQADTTSEEQSELYVYLCFKVFERSKSKDHLKLAIEMAEGLVAVAAGGVERSRRMKIFDSLSLRQLQIENGSRRDTVPPTVANFRNPNSPSSFQYKMFWERWRQTRNTEDLNRAVESIEEALRTVQLADTQLQNDHAILFLQRYHVSGRLSDLSQSIASSEKLVNATYIGHPERDKFIASLVQSLNLRFKKTGNTKDSDKAIQLAQSALDSSPSNEELRYPFWGRLAFVLVERFQLTMAFKDMKNAIKFFKTTFDAYPSGHPRQEECLDLITGITSLMIRGDTVNSWEDVVELSEIMLQVCSIVSETQAGKLINGIGMSLGSWLNLAPSGRSNIDEVIKLSEKALSKASPVHWPSHVIDALSTSLEDRFSKQRKREDLDRGLEITELSIKLVPSKDPLWGHLVTRWWKWIEHLFDETRLLTDLDKAGIILEGLLVRRDVQASFERAAIVSFTLAGYLHARFQVTGELAGLRRGVKLMEAAVKRVPVNDSLLPTFLADFAHLLGVLVRHEDTGKRDDYDKVIEILRKSIDSMPSPAIQDFRHQQILPESLHQLARWLGARFRVTGAIEDLNEAIAMERRSVKLKALYPDLVRRAISFNSLSELLNIRFYHTKQMCDLEESIRIMETACALNPLPGMMKSVVQLNLTKAYLVRHDTTGNINDQETVLRILSEIIENPFTSSVELAHALSAYGTQLGTRFEVTRNQDDLKKATDVFERLLQMQPDSFHTNFNLGILYKNRFDFLDEKEVLSKFTMHIQKALTCSANPEDRLISTKKLAPYLVKDSNWKELSQWLDKLVYMLPELTPRSLNNADKQQRLANFFGIPSDAAAAALAAGREPSDALKLLELGRGIISGLMFEMRTDVTELEAQYPEMARELVNLRETLQPAPENTLRDSFEVTMSSKDSILRESRRMHRKDAETRLNKLLENIRGQSGFEDFQAPLSNSQLQSAADPNPIVVINISEYRCDAFIVEKSGIRAIMLPKLRKVDVEKQASLLRKNSEETDVWDILEWLWDSVVQPVLNALEINARPAADEWPHIWWIPTGALSQLPLHAAGKHTEGSDETTLDRVVSSYALSIKALLYGRGARATSKAMRPKQGTGRTADDCEPIAASAYDKALVISMDKTPGHSSLAFVKEEVAEIQKLFPRMNLQPVEIQPRRDKVLPQLSECKIFHFAGHGSFNRADPSKSCLLLEDWENSPLTVGTLWEQKIQNYNPPFLAYLSACSTGANDEVRYSDEGINLIGAYQLAGFRHVIGTLWEVDDQYCVITAKKFYEKISESGLTDSVIPFALHQAMKKLRDESVESCGGLRSRSLPVSSEDLHHENNDRGARDVRNAKLVSAEKPNFYWIPYVHFGA